MIAPLVAVKRSLAWEARLDRSSLCLEADEGECRALWVFDTLLGPDGYALREMMLRLALQEQLTLYSFGPRRVRQSAAGKGMARALAPRWSERFRERLARRVQQAAAECGAAVFVVGSAKGTFAAALPCDAPVWEVQHGLLDPSYFPLGAERFFTRSATSHTLLRQMAPDAKLTELSDDLLPPATKQGDLRRARTVVCYSKNPGGGCTVAELVRFERSVVDLARRLGLPLQLKLHPRDSRLKLIARHRSFSIARYLEPPERAAGARLVVSSFSTALTAETRTGDLIMNVALSAPNPVIAAEYAWLPTVALDDLSGVADLPVLVRQ